MRYSISLVVLTLLAAAALKGSLTFSPNVKGPFFMATKAQQTDDSEDYNELSDNVTPPQGLNDQGSQLWRTLTPQQQAAVRQDIQNGMDPNQAVLNYSQKNNRQASNVEGEGSHSTSENYDEEVESTDFDQNGLENSLNEEDQDQNNSGSKPAKTNKLTSATMDNSKKSSGSDFTEDDDCDDDNDDDYDCDEDGADENNRGKNDPNNGKIYAPGGANSPEPY